MKYIRTKDGRIFDKSQETIIGNILYPRDEELLSNTISLKKDIIKQADIIEELCDEFICWMDNYGTPINAPLSESQRYEEVKSVILLGMKNKLNCWLKLGIWTEKGLVYVAKMNEEGELELL